MRKFACVLAAGLTGLVLTASALSPQGQRGPQDHTEWVRKSLLEMEKVKPGSTRAELNRVFQKQGGLSTGLQGTYAFRECVYIKVDVRFTPAGRPARDAEGRVTLVESDADVVSQISRPYLDWFAAD